MTQFTNDFSPGNKLFKLLANATTQLSWHGQSFATIIFKIFGSNSNVIINYFNCMNWAPVVINHPHFLHAKSCLCVYYYYSLVTSEHYIGWPYWTCGTELQVQVIMKKSGHGNWIMGKYFRLSAPVIWFNSLYNQRQISNISCTKSQYLNVFCLVLQLSLPNPLKPRVKPRMKM